MPRRCVALFGAALAAACTTSSRDGGRATDSSVAAGAAQPQVAGPGDSLTTRDSAGRAPVARAQKEARRDSVRAATPAPARSSTGAVAGTSPAPGVQKPSSGSGTPAFIVFRDTVLASDLDWLRTQGFTIEQVNEAAHSVSARMPADYRGNPKANPRVLRFTVAMR
ncbi:MAG TPA: hypothetical protein VHM30_06145 [Gemmatimonadaceae bacterium]|nr:hypothetical protein [Gemmatimonadaceae bacterium]